MSSKKETKRYKNVNVTVYIGVLSDTIRGISLIFTAESCGVAVGLGLTLHAQSLHLIDVGGPRILG